MTRILAGLAPPETIYNNIDTSIKFQKLSLISDNSKNFRKISGLGEGPGAYNQESVIENRHRQHLLSRRSSQFETMTAGNVK